MTRAARHCWRATTASSRRGSVHVAKSIPVAGGMAGGSADAAAALVALDRLWGVDTSDEDLLRIAARPRQRRPVRADRGHGPRHRPRELVEALTDTGTWWWVAVPSRDGLSTPAVYRHFDRACTPDAPASRRPPTTSSPRSRPATRTRLPPPCTTTCRHPPSTCVPMLGDLLDRGEAEGRSGA